LFTYFKKSFSPGVSPTERPAKGVDRIEQNG